MLKEGSMDNKNAAGALSASEQLIQALEEDYFAKGEKSVLFRYKANELKEKYESPTPDTRSDTEYATLCARYDAVMAAGEADGVSAVREYLICVLELLSKSRGGYIPSGKRRASLKRQGKGGDIYKNKSILEDFLKEWHRILENGFAAKELLKEHPAKKEKTAAKATGYFSELLAVYKDDGIDFSNYLICDEPTKKLIEEMQGRLQKSCIKKAVESDIDNWNKGFKSISKNLFDICEKEGFISFGGQRSVSEEERKKKQYVKLLHGLYAEQDEKRKSEIGMFFIPVYIDPFSGVSMCLVGRESYYYCNEELETVSKMVRAATKKYTQYKTGGDPGDSDAEESISVDDGEREELYRIQLDSMFPCALTVLKFTDVAEKSLRSDVRYEAYLAYTRWMEKVVVKNSVAKTAGEVRKSGGENSAPNSNEPEWLKEYRQQDEETQLQGLENYYNHIYAEYKKACAETVNKFCDINYFEEPVEGMEETDFYKNLPLYIAKEAAHSEEILPEARKKREELFKEEGIKFREERRKKAGIKAANQKNKKKGQA